MQGDSSGQARAADAREIYARRQAPLTSQARPPLFAGFFRMLLFSLDSHVSFRMGPINVECVCIYIYTHICIYTCVLCICMYVCVYIYIYREREIERERDAHVYPYNSHTNNIRKPYIQKTRKYNLALFFRGIDSIHSIHAARKHTLKNPVPINFGTSLCPGENHLKNMNMFGSNPWNVPFLLRVLGL